ncbi:MAG: biotin--[acetyl-CoA-carboxylase] ligase [Treponema sp.]|nr:biotin--[acetyl-CoA-carboxylase] ligase [Treponema sp.]
MNNKKKISIINPFNAPVYHEKIVSSTMDVSRRLAASGETHGTVIAADFQDAGRGRVPGRTWEMDSDTSLPFTILLRYPRIEEIPQLLTLRAGLAVSLAIEDFAPSLKNIVLIKWPNDIIINARKAAGILCEADGGNVHLGIGVNITQKEFPSHLAEKAVSLAIAAGIEITDNERFSLLEKILMRLYDELEPVAPIIRGDSSLDKTDDNKTLISRIEQRLFKKDEQVVFISGAADNGKEIKGRLAGIGEGGELLIEPAGEAGVCSFITGELRLFQNPAG